MIQVIKGDLSRLDFDLIVNPANIQLLPGSGVNGRIFARAGKGLLEEMLRQPEQKAGSIILSDPYHLRCRKIIHAVGPVYNFHQDNEQELLIACYWNSMAAAYRYRKENHLSRVSIAFPAISTGPYGFPEEEACQIAVHTIRRMYHRFPEIRTVDVCFVCENQQQYELYKGRTLYEINDRYLSRVFK